jgi:hypothetical protein
MKRWMSALVCGVLLLAGCNNDDEDVINAPVDTAVETGMNQALSNTVVPLVTFMGAMGDLLSGPGAVAGVACPDTGGWCSSGAVSCTTGVDGLDFAFDQCPVVGGDGPLTLDGDVTALPGTTIALTLTNLTINGSAAVSGTGTIETVACRYTVDMHASGTSVSGTVTQCDADEFPTGGALAISFGEFLVTVTFNGSSTAPATATRNGTPVATCSIDLAASPLTSTCDAI